MTKKMLTRHNLFGFMRHKKKKMKEAIGAFIIEEVELQMATAEIIYGFHKLLSCEKNPRNTVLFGSDESYKKDEKESSFSMIRGYSSLVPSNRKL